GRHSESLVLGPTRRGTLDDVAPRQRPDADELRLCIVVPNHPGDTSPNHPEDTSGAPDAHGEVRRTKSPHTRMPRPRHRGELIPLEVEDGPGRPSEAVAPLDGQGSLPARLVQLVRKRAA